VISTRPVNICAVDVTANPKTTTSAVSQVVSLPICQFMRSILREQVE
jgi:hypothetical protein